jgi:uridine kinase
MKKKLFFLPLIFLFFIFSANTAEHSRSLDSLEEYLLYVIQHRDKSKPVPIVAIGGCPGVGKSYLAKDLKKRLQKRHFICQILALDDFNLSSEERKKMAILWDIHHFKLSELHECLNAIHSGKKIIFKPTYDQITGKTSSEILNLTHTDLVLFEGLYALCSKEPLNFFHYCEFGVFLEANEADVYLWKWQREQKKIHPRTEEEYAKHTQSLLTEYHKNIEYSKKNAIFFINKDSDHNYQIQSLF